MLNVMWYSSPLETLTERDSFEEENEEEEKAPQPIFSFLSSAIYGSVNQSIIIQ